MVFDQRAYHRDWWAEHREQQLARKAAYREAHRAELAAKQRAHYAANRERILEQQAGYQRANPTVVARARRAYRKRVSGPWVYVCYQGSTVIYVGRCTNVSDRLANHRHGTRPSAWVGEVTRILTRRCATYADSLVLESLLIRKYQPKYNTVGVSR